MFSRIGWLWLGWMICNFPTEPTIERAVRIIARTNIFYVKILQALSGYIDSPAIERMTDRVPYDISEMSDEFRRSIDRTNAADSWADTRTPDTRTPDTGTPDTRIRPTSISTEPVHQGTVSLIYEAMTYSGHRVAIKVLRRGIVEKVDRATACFDILTDLSAYIPYIRNFNLRTVYRENRSLMYRQLDFAAEVVTMERMRRNHRSNPEISIPWVVPEYTAADPTIIVMEWIDGRGIDELTPDERDRYADILTRFGLKSMMIDGLYHGDLHRGNVLFGMSSGVSSGVSSAPPTARILDFGIADTIDSTLHPRILDFFTAICDRDSNMMATYLCTDLAVFTHNNSNPDLLREITCMMEEILLAGTDIGPLHLNRINRILARFGGMLNPDFCRVHLSFAVCDGVMKRLNGSADYHDRMMRGIAHVLGREGGGSTPDHADRNILPVSFPSNDILRDILFD
jgi:predicted unusual protein kinase regulating ubiquinone biosynthesis (AarF/ABC1/UbiB family)